jgi:hypothetical protein
MKLSSLLQLLFAFLIGATITALTTFALVRHVQTSIATAQVSSDPSVWMQTARTQAYEPCYDGCDDCDDPDWAYNACAMTASVNVTGVICDGNLMWNWVERYPLECLQALGEIYQADALSQLKQSYRNQFAVIIITVLAGVFVAVVTYKIWGCIAADAATATTHPGRGIRWRRCLITAAFASMLSRSGAFPCAGYDPVADQYFVNANKTLYGVVHGWFSDCYTYSCDCSTDCSSGGDDSPSCFTSCDTCTSSDLAPITYVNATLPYVQACGFELVDAVDGDVDVRVANPLIEKNWLVKISVNMFNLTNVTDPSIFCLHDFANQTNGT